MPYHFTSPVIEKESTIKDIIIEILSAEFPSTARKIFNIVRKNYRKQVSYQAVYKALHELLDVIDRAGMEPVAVFGDRENVMPTPDHRMLEVMAQKR